MVQRVLILAIFFALPGCLGSSGGGSNTDFIPSVQMECSSAQASACAASSADVFIGLLLNTSVNCPQYLYSLTRVTRQSAFDASSTITATKDSSTSFLTGLFTNWDNSNGAEIDLLSKGTYQACAFVDSNGNGQLDSGEAVGEGEVTMGSINVIVNDWITY